MGKFGSFVLGCVVGIGAGLAAASMAIPDDTTEKMKKRLEENENFQDLKKKYDKGTEIIKSQMSSFPKDVEDDSELKDFDDIVIDNTSKNLGEDSKSDEDSISDLRNSED